MSWLTSEDHAAQFAVAGAAVGASSSGSETAQTTRESSAISPIILAACLCVAVAGGAFFSVAGTIGLDALPIPASLNGLTSASLDDLLGAIGLSRTKAADAQQQAAKIAKLDRGMEAVSSQVVDLLSRMEAAGIRNVEDGQRIARLTDQMTTIASAADDPYSVAGNGVDVALLRSSIDAISARNDSRIAAINKRLDRIETVVAGRPTTDVTGSISRIPTHRRARHTKLSGWTAQEMLGDITLTGRTGTFEATPGSQVPGLGRIEAIRREQDHTLVVTNRGTIL